MKCVNSSVQQEQTSTLNLSIKYKQREYLHFSAHQHMRGISDDGARLKKLFLQLIFILLSQFHLKSLSLIYGDTVVQDGS